MKRECTEEKEQKGKGEGRIERGKKHPLERESEFMLSLANSFVPCNCLKAGFKTIIELVYFSRVGGGSGVE